MLSKFGNKFSFKRNVDFIKKKATRGGGSFDRMIKDAYNMFIAQQGVNRVRLLPANPEYWGQPLYVHYIGENESPYLCLKKMKGEECSVCEERRRADAAGDNEYGKALFPRERLLVWVIDREKESEGPRLWDMPKTIEIDLNSAAVDDSTNEVLPLDHPEEGYDIRFNKEGKGKTTRYSGITVARRASPITDREDKMEEWLQFILDNPLDQCLIFYSYDHIKGVFTGKPAVATTPKPQPADEEPAQTPMGDDARDKDAVQDEGPDEESADEESADDVSARMSALRDRMNNRK